MAAAGCPPGSYRISDVDVEVGADRRVSLKGTPYLAGSALSMHEAVANTVRFTGLSIEEVLPMASSIPARYAGIDLDGIVSADWDPDRYELAITDVLTNVSGVQR
jgi:N-acetylglucosamine-6-phosphate deacetylase